jgi:hypothetical protein
MNSLLSHKHITCTCGKRVRVVSPSSLSQFGDRAPGALPSTVRYVGTPNFGKAGGSL